jgi:hypothetical protein
MNIPNNLLSANLAQMAETHLASVRASLDRLDNVACTTILIEAARVIDYENVLMGSDADEAHHLPYPVFDVMCRGWNPLLNYLLPRLQEHGGVPIQESTPNTRSYARSLLHAFGQCSVLRKAADMAFHGFLTGHKSGDVLRLKFTISDQSDHFLDRLEADELEITLNGKANGKSNRGSMAKDEIDKIVTSLVFPFDTGRGRMVGYDADPKLDAHFIELVGEQILKWRAEAGIHPAVRNSTLDGADVVAVVLMLTSFYLKHIWFVGVGSKQLEDINYCMSLTIWKKPEDLVESISDFADISVERVEAALRSVLVTKEDAGYFGTEGTPYMPMLLEVSEGYWLASVSSIFRNPFESIWTCNGFAPVT